MPSFYLSAPLKIFYPQWHLSALESEDQGDITSVHSVTEAGEFFFSIDEDVDKELPRMTVMIFKEIRHILSKSVLFLNSYQELESYDRFEPFTVYKWCPINNLTNYVPLRFRDMDTEISGPLDFSLPQ